MAFASGSTQASTVTVTYVKRDFLSASIIMCYCFSPPAIRLFFLISFVRHFNWFIIKSISFCFQYQFVFMISSAYFRSQSHLHWGTLMYPVYLCISYIRLFQTLWCNHNPFHPLLLKRTVAITRPILWWNMTVFQYKTLSAIIRTFNWTL